MKRVKGEGNVFVNPEASLRRCMELSPADRGHAVDAYRRMFGDIRLPAVIHKGRAYPSAEYQGLFGPQNFLL